MESERSVNPACPNAGNPFHQCGDYCAGGGGRRIAVTAGKSSVVNGEVARVEGRIVDPNCVNAANPFHQCAEYCTKKAAEVKKQAVSGRFAFPVLSKLSPRSRSDRSDGSKSASGAGVRVEGRNVDPNCVNASNPFHQCADYCTNRRADGRQQIRTGPKAQNGELIKGAVRKMEEGRKVDPKCVNASNPFHQCTEHCSPRTLGARRQISERALVLMGKDSLLMMMPIIPGALIARESEEEKSTRENSREEMVIRENRKVDPRCPNASNPFHQCAEYCLQKISGSSGGEGSKSDRNKRSASIVMEKRDVDPRCVNASNPFHKCAEYCFERIREAT